MTKILLKETNKTLDEKRELLYSMLHAGEVTVEFTKVDGDLRVMPCSLSTSIVPASNKPVTEDAAKPRKVNLETIRVYVTDIKEWRSFRIENVISVITE